MCVTFVTTNHCWGRGTKPKPCTGRRKHKSNESQEENPNKTKRLELEMKILEKKYTKGEENYDPNKHSKADD